MLLLILMLFCRLNSNIFHLAVHESKPAKDVTGTIPAVRGPDDSLDTAHDVSSVPAVVPGSRHLSDTGEDGVHGALHLVLGGGRGHNKEGGKDNKELGHFEARCVLSLNRESTPM